MITKNQLAPYEQTIISLRRYFHQHPETGFDVSNTHDKIAALLKEKKIDVREHVGKNSLIGVLKNGKGRTIGLRADIDALPLQEANTDLPYVSTVPGKMHACGHDAHTAMLLGAAFYLADHLIEWSGTVKFIFQEAEEGPNPGGAYGIVKSGLLDDVDTFFAFHVAPMFEVGKVAIKNNEAMASADTIKITLHGKGAHAAYPHLGIDPILMAAEVIQGVQTILSRRKNPLDPAVITIAKVVSGTTHNIIPEQAYLEGTVRTFSSPLRDFIKEELHRLLQSVTQKSGGSYDLEYIYEYDPTINTPSEFTHFKNVVESTLGKESFIEIQTPSMGSEDFSRYIQQKKGCMAWLGVNSSPQTSYSLHHPKFNLDESALAYGSMTYVNLVTSGKEENI